MISAWFQSPRNVVIFDNICQDGLVFHLTHYLLKLEVYIRSMRAWRMITGIRLPPAVTVGAAEAPGRKNSKVPVDRRESIARKASHPIFRSPLWLAGTHLMFWRCAGWRSPLLQSYRAHHGQCLLIGVPVGFAASYIVSIHVGSTVQQIFH